MTEVVEEIRSRPGLDEHSQQHGEFGGDDGNRTRVRGFADRSLTTRARRRGTRWLPREDSNLGSRIQSPLSCQLDDGASSPSSEASRSLLQGQKKWSGRRDSNPRPSPWQGDALPTEPLPPVHRHAARDGAEGQNRTDDTRLFRAVLYQLSYLGPPHRSAPCGPLVVASRLATIAQGPIERQPTARLTEPGSGPARTGPPGRAGRRSAPRSADGCPTCSRAASQSS
jgi:hypothetical protein